MDSVWDQGLAPLSVSWRGSRERGVEWETSERISGRAVCREEFLGTTLQQAARTLQAMLGFEMEEMWEGLPKGVGPKDRAEHEPSDHLSGEISHELGKGLAEVVLVAGVKDVLCTAEMDTVSDGRRGWRLEQGKEVVL